MVVEAYRGSGLVGTLCLRPGRPGETYADASSAAVRAEGRPVLCDARGPLGGPLGPAVHAAPGPGARRVLVVFYLSPDLDGDAARSLLAAASQTLREACGGREVGRAVLPARGHSPE